MTTIDNRPPDILRSEMLHPGRHDHDGTQVPRPTRVRRGESDR